MIEGGGGDGVTIVFASGDGEWGSGEEEEIEGERIFE